MIKHGNSDAPLQFVMHYDDASGFPFSIAGTLMERVCEQERFALLRPAVEVWHEAHGDGFVRLFHYRWKLLPEKEARILAWFRAAREER